jgi:hypothetical protein
LVGPVANKSTQKGPPTTQSFIIVMDFLLLFLVPNEPSLKRREMLIRKKETIALGNTQNIKKC